MANELEKILLRDSQDPEQRPGKFKVEAERQRQAVEASRFIGLTDPQSPRNDTEMVFGSREYLRRGVRAGAEQVKGSFDGLAAIGNLIAGDKDAAQINLNRMQQHDEQIQAALAPLEPFENFLEEPTLGGAFNQILRAGGQFAYPAALTVGEALAGGLIATAGRTAFTSAGRAALKDTLTKTTRKIGNLRNNRRLEPVALLPGTVDEGAEAAVGANAFEELWFKTLRNKGIDNLTPEEKVVMDVSRKYLRDAKIGGALGAFAAAETMIAPEILREYQEAGMELTGDEAAMALLVGVPAAGIEVLGEAVFFGSLFKLAAGTTRLNKARARAARGEKLSKRDVLALNLANLARAKGLDSIGRLGQNYLRKYEKRSALELMRDIGRVTLASKLSEGSTELLQEELIMSQAQLNNPTFDIQGAEAKLRRSQAFFDGAAAGGARGVLGGVSASVFRQARDFIIQKKADLEWQSIQDETYANLQDLGLPEAKEDIFAQLNSMVDPDYKREAVWIPIDALRANGLLDEDGTTINRTALQEFLLEAYESQGKDESNVPEIHLSIDKDGNGILLSVNPNLNTYYNNQRFQDVSVRDVLTDILDFVATPDSSTGNEVVVQLLENDKVVWEQTTPPEQVQEVVIKADEQYKPEEKYSVMKDQILDVEPEVEPTQLDLPLPETEQPQSIDALEEAVLEKMANNEDFSSDLAELQNLRSTKKKRQVVIKSIEEVAEDRVEANIRDEETVSAEDKKKIEGRIDRDIGSKKQIFTNDNIDDVTIIRKNMGDAAAALYINLAHDRFIANINADPNLSAEEKQQRIEAVEASRQRNLTDAGLNNVEPTENPIIRDMAEEEDLTTSDIEQELKQAFIDAGISETEATEFISLGIRPEDITNVPNIGQTTLVSGRQQDAFKPVDSATYEKLNEKDATTLRTLRAKAQSFLVRAELNNTDIFIDDTSGELSEVNEAIIVLNQEVDKKQDLFENLTSRDNTTLRKINAAIKDAKTAEEAKKIIRLNNSLNVEATEYYAFKTKLQNRLIELDKRRQELEAKRSDILSKGSLAGPKEVSQLTVESLLLQDLGIGKQRRENLLQGSAVGFLREVDILLDQLEDRVISDDNGFVLGEDAKEKIRSAMQKEALELAMKSSDLTPDEAKQLARESILQRAEVDGIPLRQFGLNSGPSVSSVLADYIDGAEFSLVDPEINKANAAILKNYIRASEADPNSVFRIATSAVIIPTVDNIFKKDSISLANLVGLASPDATVGPNFIMSSDEFDLVKAQDYISNLKSLFKKPKEQGAKQKTIPTIVLEQRFGASTAKELLAFVRTNSDALGLKIEDNYQVILKERTAESLPELYNDKFSGMTPEKAVQTAMSTATEKAFLNNQVLYGSYYKTPGKNAMQFSWVKRTYTNGQEVDQVLSFNDVLSAGTAIFDSKLDSIEKETIPYTYRVAMGFATLLEQKYLTSFKDQNDKEAEILFQYKTRTPDGIVYRTIPIKSIAQELGKDPFADAPEIMTLNNHKNLPTFNAPILKKLSLPKIIKELSEVGSAEFMRKKAVIPQFDLLNLPIYYDSASKSFKSAKELVENFNQTPYYRKRQKLRKLNLVKQIVGLQRKITDPQLEDINSDYYKEGIPDPDYTLEELDLAVTSAFLQQNNLKAGDRAISERLNLNDLQKDIQITSGMQIGVDAAGAELALKHNIPLYGVFAGTTKGKGKKKIVVPRTQAKEIKMLFPELVGTEEFKSLQEEVEFLNTTLKTKINPTSRAVVSNLGYKERTELVVKSSDGVILFSDVGPDGGLSPGTALTKRIADSVNISGVSSTFRRQIEAIDKSINEINANPNLSTEEKQNAIQPLEKQKKRELTKAGKKLGLDDLKSLSDLPKGIPVLLNPKSEQEIIQFLTNNKIKRLNIAGSGEAAPALSKTIDYEKILDDALRTVANLTQLDRRTSDYRQAKQEYVEAAIKNPGLYFFPSLEEKLEILESIARQNKFLIQEDYAQEVMNISDLFGDEEGKLDNFNDDVRGAFGDEEMQEFDFIREKTASTYNPKITLQQINGERVVGRVGVSDGPGVFVEDRVSSQYKDISNVDGQGISRQILDLLRKNNLEADEVNLLNRLKRNAKTAFPDATDLYNLRTEIAQNQGFNLSKVGQLVDPINILSNVAVQTLGLGNRRIYVMFEDKPIIFDDPHLNVKVDELINGVKEGEEKSFRDDLFRPETMLLYKGLDIIVLKNPQKYTSQLNEALARDPKSTASVELSEVEGVILAGLFHSFGHSFFHEYHETRITPDTSFGKALLDEFKQERDKEDAPKQYKEKYGFEEKIADNVASVVLKQAPKVATVSAREKAYVAGLVRRMKRYSNESKMNFIRKILRRTTKPTTDNINNLIVSVAEDFAGTYKDRGSGRQATFEIFEDLKNQDPIIRDMSEEEIQTKVDKIFNSSLSSNQIIKEFNRLLKKVFGSNIRYLQTVGFTQAFIDAVYKETQQKGQGLGFIQEKDQKFNRVLNNLFEPLIQALNIPLGDKKFGIDFDDNEISPKGRRQLKKAFTHYSEDMDALGEVELQKQVEDSEYRSGLPNAGNGVRKARLTTLALWPIFRRVKLDMQEAQLSTMDNFDLSRNYDIDKLSNSSFHRNSLIALVMQYNNNINKSEATKTVDEMIQNRETGAYLAKEEVEINPMVSSVAVGMSPSRQRLLKNIPTHRLLENELLTDIVDSQIFALRSITNKIVFNEKVRHLLTDKEIERARGLVSQKTFTSKTQEVKTDFLQTFADMETRAEQRERLKNNNEGLPAEEKLKFDEDKYDMRGWRAATAEAWLNPKVPDPIEATYALSAILGKAGMSINNMPVLRNFQAGAALLNQVTFLTFSALSTLPEFVGPIIQRGNLEGFGLTTKAIIRNLRNKDEVNNMMRAVGQMGISQAIEASIYAGDLGWMTDTTARYSKLFFKSIFITKMMNHLNRNAGLVALYAIEADTKRALAGDKKSIERLDNIGLTAREAKYAMDKIGFFQGAPKSFVEYDKAFRTDATTVKFRDAINMLVGEMMLKPNAAQRTIWMNNPFFALLAQLKPFYYSFGKVFGENVYNNMKREAKYTGTIGAMTPLLIMLATMLPLAMLGLELRELLKYVLQGGNPKVFRSDDMTWPTYMFDIVDRSGVTGRYGLLIPAMEADLYGDTFFTPLLGPTPERVIDIIEGRGNVWDYVPYFGAAGYD